MSAQRRLSGFTWKPSCPSRAICSPCVRPPSSPSPNECAKKSSGRDATFLESSWRIVPAAELRGFSNARSPAATRSSFIRSNPSSSKSTSPRTLRYGGAPSASSNRHRAHGPHVVRHVLADLAIAARPRARELPVLVHELDRETVELRLHEERHLGVASDPLEMVAATTSEVAELVGAEDVREREERDPVHERCERLERRAADPRRRRALAAKCRESLLERLQLSVEQVVLAVGDLRRVELVVEPIVPVELGGQPVHARRSLLLVECEPRAAPRFEVRRRHGFPPRQRS